MAADEGRKVMGVQARQPLKGFLLLGVRGNTVCVPGSVLSPSHECLV